MLLTLAAACADGGLTEEDLPDAGLAEADAGSVRDAGPTDPDATPPAPSPANVGWIGGACAAVMDCADVNDGFCLE